MRELLDFFFEMLDFIVGISIFANVIISSRSRLFIIILRQFPTKVRKLLSHRRRNGVAFFFRSFSVLFAPFFVLLKGSKKGEAPEKPDSDKNDRAGDGGRVLPLAGTDSEGCLYVGGISIMQ